jgi:hypothetical protein
VTRAEDMCGNGLSQRVKVEIVAGKMCLKGVECVVIRDERIVCGNLDFHFPEYSHYQQGCAVVGSHYGGDILVSDVAIAMDEATGGITVEGDSTVAYRFRIVSFTAPEGVEGADAWNYDAESKIVTIDKEGASFTVRIDGGVGYGNPGDVSVGSSAPRRYGRGTGDAVEYVVTDIQGRVVRRVYGKAVNVCPDTSPGAGLWIVHEKNRKGITGKRLLIR